MDALLAPLQVRGVRLPSRVVMAPMTRYRSPGGVPGPDVATYYARRAATGVGLIMTEGVGVPHAAAVDHPHVPRLDSPEALSGWRGVTQSVHAAGGIVWAQLWHQGPMWGVEYDSGSGVHVPAPAAALRPSGIWGPPDGMISIPESSRTSALPRTRPMSESQIQDVIDAFALAARNAMRVGFDGIALHGGHGYLIDSFLWARTNCRDDAWGGDLRRRAAFGAALLAAVRRTVGETVPIALRFSQFKMQDYRAQIARTPQELAQLLEPLAEAGLDLFDASQRYFDTPAFEGSSLNLAGWAKKLTGKLSMTVGGVGLGKGSGPAVHMDRSQGSANNLPQLLERFSRGEFDLVGVGRALLNDPGWFTRARHAQPFLPFDPENLQRLT